MKKASELKKLSYEELEKEEEETLKKLGEDSLALDKANELYQYGKAVLKERDNRLSSLEKSVEDKVDGERE